MKLNAVHFTNRSTDQLPPETSSIFSWPSLDPTCSWFRTVSSILLGLFLSHKTLGLNIHSFLLYNVSGTGNTKVKESFCPQQAPQRGPYSRIPWASALMRSEHGLCHAAGQSPVQESPLPSETVPSSSPNRAYKTQPWWAHSSLSILHNLLG